jgi:2-(1,2-epoxy-1,2-dihydrophenyl)acetyl-CoA isomerase
MTYQTILFEMADGVGRLTLNRPERLNSFTVAMHTEVRELLERLAREPQLRVLTLSGAGRGFCAGQDLNDRAVRADGAAAVDLGESIERYYKPLVLALRGLPVPVIAAVNGVAAGAGANIALACDLVIAARSATFIQSFAKLGLVPDCGGTWLLPRLVGDARARGLALLGDKLSAEQAQEWGLIWRCVEDSELGSVVDEVARQLAAAAPRGLARTKQALDGAGQRTLEQQLDIERDFQRELGYSSDFAEGVAAFTQKRAPHFTGH